MRATCALGVMIGLGTSCGGDARPLDPIQLGILIQVTGDAASGDADLVPAAAFDMEAINQAGCRADPAGDRPIKPGETAC